MRLLLPRLSCFGLVALIVFPGCLPEAEPPVGRGGAEKPATADKAEAADIAALVRGNNQFTFDLLRALEPDRNQFLSPFRMRSRTTSKEFVQ
jgi:hypothetical protein